MMAANDNAEKSISISEHEVTVWLINVSQDDLFFLNHYRQVYTYCLYTHVKTFYNYLATV